MTTNWKRCLGVGCIVAAGLSAFPQTAPDRTTTLQITIRIFDLVHISPRSLANAEKEASRIFQKAGLQTQWLHCPPSLKEARSNTYCEKPLGANDLDLSINTRSEGRRSGATRAWLGYAFPFAERNHASISYEHVQDLAKASLGRPSLAAILGHVIAHEIGHLLLRSTTHSLNGIMRAAWNQEDLHNAAQGVLTFTPQEADSLRNEAQKRFKRQSSERCSRLQLRRDGPEAFYASTWWRSDGGVKIEPTVSIGVEIPKEALTLTGRLSPILAEFGEPVFPDSDNRCRNRPRWLRGKKSLLA